MNTPTLITVKCKDCDYKQYTFGEANSIDKAESHMMETGHIVDIEMEE